MSPLIDIEWFQYTYNSNREHEHDLNGFVISKELTQTGPEGFGGTGDLEKNLENILENINLTNAKVLADDYTKIMILTDNYMIKMIPNSENCDDIIHEAFVLNTLNSGSPKNQNFSNSVNFCKLVAYGKSEKVLMIAPFQNHWRCGVNYLIIERCHNSMLLSEYLGTLGNAEAQDFGSTSGTEAQNFSSNPCKKFIKILEQLIHLLYTLNKKFGFTHYDLYLKNILIKKLDEKVELQYINKTIMSKTVVVLIDFEFSHIMYMNENYGIERTDVNIQNRSYWIHDIVKVLLSLRTCNTLGFFNFNKLTEDLLKYFFGENLNINEILKIKQINEYYNVRYRTHTFSFEEFISHFYKVTGRTEGVGGI
jgi:hypothetical protein